MRLERRYQALLPFREFWRRLATYGAVACVLVVMSLGIGMLGYHLFAGLPWVDSLLNASMILTGMGPVDPMRTTAGKLFASAYALFSGVAFLSIVGVLLAPVVHRFLHHFHLEIDEAGDPH
jgi:hypothetical protein